MKKFVLIVKGPSKVALEAATSRGLNPQLVLSRGGTTKLLIEGRERDGAEIAKWFLSDLPSKPPFSPGSLLWYREGGLR